MEGITKEDALQAAMLAKLVGGHLSTIDNYSGGSNSIRANRINMQEFIDPLLNKPQHAPAHKNYAPVDNRFSSPPPEDIIRQMIPEPPPKNSQQTETQLPQSSNVETLLKSIDENLKLLVSFIKNG